MKFSSFFLFFFFSFYRVADPGSTRLSRGVGVQAASPWSRSKIYTSTTHLRTHHPSQVAPFTSKFQRLFFLVGAPPFGCCAILRGISVFFQRTPLVYPGQCFYACSLFSPFLWHGRAFPAMRGGITVPLQEKVLKKNHTSWSRPLHRALSSMRHCGMGPAAL